MNVTFHWSTRSAIRSPSSLQYRKPLRGFSFTSPLRNGKQVVAVDVHLEGLVAGLVPLLELLDDVGIAAGCGQRGQHVRVREHLVGHRSRLDARPASG